MKPISQPEAETETIILFPSRPIVIAGEYRSKTYLLIDSISFQMQVKYVIRIRQSGDSGLKPTRHLVQVWQVLDSTKSIREVTELKPDHLLTTLPIMFSDRNGMETETRRIAKEFSINQ